MTVLADHNQTQRTAPTPAACVILAGGIKPSGLVRETGQSVLAAQLAGDVRVLEAWTAVLAALIGPRPAPVPQPTRRTTVATTTTTTGGGGGGGGGGDGKTHGQNASSTSTGTSTGTGTGTGNGTAARFPELTIISGAAMPHFALDPARPTALPTRIVRDRADYRGPAGAALDACGPSCKDGATVVIAEAARAPLTSLTGVYRRHHDEGNDVTIVRNADATPAGVYFASGEALRLTPELGFVDIKEQWLPTVVQKGMRVRVADVPAPGFPELRTRHHLLKAVRMWAEEHGGAAHHAERVWARGGVGPCVIDPSARVGAGAVISEAVVGPGADVGEGAVIVRAIVGQGAVVAPGERVLDRTVVAERGTAEQHKDHRKKGRWGVGVGKGGRRA